MCWDDERPRGSVTFCGFDFNFNLFFSCGIKDKWISVCTLNCELNFFNIYSKCSKLAVELICHVFNISESFVIDLQIICLFRCLYVYVNNFLDSIPYFCFLRNNYCNVWTDLSLLVLLSLFFMLWLYLLLYVFWKVP